MKRFALLILFAVPPSVMAGPLTDQVISPSVEVCDKDSGIGTGTVIEWKGKKLILTAAHVIEDAGSFTVRLKSRVGKLIRYHKATVILYDGIRDLALLEPVDPKTLPPGAKIAPVNRELEAGDDVWYCGSGGGMFQNLQRSIINQLDDKFTWVNGGGWYGHSGSGVYRKSKRGYEMIAVLVVLRDGRNPKAPLGCVPLADLHSFLKRYR